MWLLIDNYDSFTHILCDYLLQLGQPVTVIKNDAYTLEQIIEMRPQRIIISPGPKTPDDAGITMAVIHHFHDKMPILGICLGHQALAQYFGAKIIKAAYPMHGKTSAVYHKQEYIFQDLPNPLIAMRYHSLVVEDIDPNVLTVLAKSEEGLIMALKHKEYPCVGVQFHPESVLTPQGMDLLRNWANNI
ncbi:anthranilate/aminodeoxychorismate synthase component II [Taibaiella sp. KBW10]|uniref:anthranilate synthase component II n=1 Tax=Taibaiella sp. KBW10 TaxID=2153357 RepID=UPI000F5A82BA|nr:aminodeoxychorismate/anthranilate synthase component II [Taibaiella sp. KBW10]RQO30104.1 anthranilate/aminodeoxychorismate synthase component II [Taibaiella sp. KBW10]